MTTSPIQFAKQFARLREIIQASAASDLKLLQMFDFWPELKDHRDEPAYASYYDEFTPLVENFLTDTNLHDLSLDELTGLREMASDLSLKKPASLVVRRMAKVYCYVGEVDKALQLFAEIAGEQCNIPDSEIYLETLSEFERLQAICSKIPETYSMTKEMLCTIADEWESERGHLWFDRARCLFVEKNTNGKASRGRMRTLIGSAKMAEKNKNGDAVGAATIEVTFENQITTPDDPFIGVVYDGLTAVRAMVTQPHSGILRGSDKSRIQARFQIEDADHAFTGDSIGLAAALVAYAQLLKPDIARYERFISSEVAFTGGIDRQGRLLPVNKDTLSVKVERAFFSSVKYLVLPESNIVVARECVTILQEKYPHRDLQLIPSTHIGKVACDHNIVRAERVCMGQFVAQKAGQYGRMVKIQVPLLLALLWVLLAFFYPRFFNPWFDRNPKYVKVTTRGFEALNKDSIFLWDVEYECEGIEAIPKWQTGDLDGDGMNEIALAPKSLGPCDRNAVLHVYDSEGELLFERTMVQRMPNDDVGDQFVPSVISFQPLNDRHVIITVACRSGPARGHVRIWSRTGDSLVTYINKGFPGPSLLVDVDSNGENEILFCGINNPMASVCLFTLGDGPCNGESPPRAPGPGPEEVYLIVPPTGVSQQLVEQYNCVLGVSEEAPGRVRLIVCENISRIPRCDLYYYFDERMRVTSVLASDSYIAQWEAFVEQGLLPDESLVSVQARARDNVTYWTDSGWVTEGELRALEER
ncbi:MAG: hypothetical protein KOO62_13040 [candidate division Zixibacteria bacterium]|nr:hypothetical protein [candidate division Zixibacteria bacterium]